MTRRKGGAWNVGKERERLQMERLGQIIAVCFPPDNKEPKRGRKKKGRKKDGGRE